MVTLCARPKVRCKRLERLTNILRPFATARGNSENAGKHNCYRGGTVVSSVVLLDHVSEMCKMLLDTAHLPAFRFLSLRSTVYKYSRSRHLER